MPPKEKFMRLLVQQYNLYLPYVDDAKLWGNSWWEWAEASRIPVETIAGAFTRLSTQPRRNNTTSFPTAQEVARTCYELIAEQMGFNTSAQVAWENLKHLIAMHHSRESARKDPTYKAVYDNLVSSDTWTNISRSSVPDSYKARFMDEYSTAVNDFIAARLKGN